MRTRGTITWRMLYLVGLAAGLVTIAPDASLPPRQSRWLHADMRTRVRRRVPVACTFVHAADDSD